MSNLLYPVDEKDRRIAELEAALKLSEEFDQDWDEAVARIEARAVKAEAELQKLGAAYAVAVGELAMAWDRNQMESLVAQAIEECAKVAETHESILGRPAQSLWDDDQRMLKTRGLEIASAIRALKGSP